MLKKVKMVITRDNRLKLGRRLEKHAGGRARQSNQLGVEVHIG